jgi:hypothetical protein
VDVLLDRFVMAHELDLRDSASADGLTIALADLLTTKLQVVNINDKDVRDLLALLLDHELGTEAIETARILDATRNDWGLEHTIHRSLETLARLLGDYGLKPAQQDVIQGRVSALGEALDGAPKGAKWKLRARVGERVRWYEEPEEARG